MVKKGRGKKRHRKCKKGTRARGEGWEGEMECYIPRLLHIHARERKEKWEEEGKEGCGALKIERGR